MRNVANLTSLPNYSIGCLSHRSVVVSETDLLISPGYLEHSILPRAALNANNSPKSLVSQLF